jgi:cyclic pyranopterin phosphate synthase
VNGDVLDTLARPIRDLRVSITDRCNFRCTYCMPRDVYGSEHVFVPHEEILRYEEIARLTRVLVGLGVRKVRVTGGEPLLRRDVEDLVRMLAAIDGIDDLALTTNGSALESLAPKLVAAGLHRVTVSLDALDDAVFRGMNDAGFPVDRVLRGIDAAAAAGLVPVKVNAVVKRGVNEDQVLPMARYFHERGHHLRFIEYMDVGKTNGWRLDDVVSAAEILETLKSEFDLEPIEPAYRGEVASRYRFRDGGGEVGFVTSVTRPFCKDCTRLRLSADGQLFTCLFAARGHDVKALLRSDATDEDIRDRLVAIWNARDDRYSELRASETTSTDRIEMSYIGG